MKTKDYFVLALLLCTCLTGYSQRNCGSMDYLEQQLLDNPKLFDKRQEIEKATQHFITNPEKAVNGIVTIPVVVHVVYNMATQNISTAQINSQLNVLTEDFRRMNSDANSSWTQAADTEIEFCLASVNPQGNPTSGITRTSTNQSSFGTNDSVKFTAQGGRDAWPSQHYLNIWVCNIGGGILGYAQFPGGPASTDGVVVDYRYFGTTGTATAPFNLGRTCTHEVGHWLNLYHIWGDGPCSADDMVSDTPNSDNPNYGCPLNHMSCSSLDMVANYMDYTDDSCMNLYTNGQRSRMRALFDTGGSRAGFLNSPGCGSAAPPTCSDGIQNGDETGIDCGGSVCPSCGSCAFTEVVLTIVLDDYPEETSWEIVDANNNAVASGGNYGSLGSGAIVSEILCLEDGCYDFTINDSYGDGICCAYGNGSYLLEDTGSNSTLASGGSFGSSETTNFCLNGSPPPTCSDGIQNGDETGVDCGGSICPPCSGCPDTEVTLTLMLDDYPEETSWEIVNTNNNTIASGGPYGISSAGNTITESLCIEDGCYNFIISDSYGDGICCAFGNGGYILTDDSTGNTLASGGSFGFQELTNFCIGSNSGGCTDHLINFNNFDSGWGIWIDGGADCRRSANDSNYAYSSPRPVRLRDNTNTSLVRTQSLNLSGFEEVTIAFTYITASMENGKDFWLQMKAGNGSWQTVEDYVKGVDFLNNAREFESVTIQGPFGLGTKFRFRCDAANNGDRVYIDDVEITGCSSSATRVINGDDVNEENPVIFEEADQVGRISDLKIYPNPSSYEATVLFVSELDQDIRLNVYNGMGQLIRSGMHQVESGETRMALLTTDFQTGLYFIEIQTKNEGAMERLLVIK